MGRAEPEWKSYGSWANEVRTTLLDYILLQKGHRTEMKMLGSDRWTKGTGVREINTIPWKAFGQHRPKSAAALWPQINTAFILFN